MGPRGALRLQGTFQEFTFIASIVMQIVTLIVSSVALAQGDKVPNTLMTILILELVLQIAQQRPEQRIVKRRRAAQQQRPRHGTGRGTGR